MQYKEMQVGDKVEITDRRTVTISRIDEAQNAYDARGSIILADEGREFGLIERPQKPLPETRGSVIRVKHASGGSAHWMLTSRDTWVSEIGVKKFSPELTDFVNSVGLQWEVVL